MIDWEARSAISGGNADLRIGGGAAMHIAGLALKGWRPHNFRSSTNRCSTKVDRNSGCPTGVPKILIPSGFHTSGPRSSVSTGRSPAKFHMRVLPVCNRIPARSCNVVLSKLYNTRVRSGEHKTYMSSRNAKRDSPGSNCC